MAVIYELPGVQSCAESKNSLNLTFRIVYSYIMDGQDREPVSLEQFPDEILFMHIVFNKQNYHRVHINLFNGLRAVAWQYGIDALPDG